MGLQAYMMFTKQAGGSLKEQRDAWKKLGTEGQAEWHRKAKEAEQQYQKDLAAFDQTKEGKKYKREKLAFEKKQKMQLVRHRFLGANAQQEPKKTKECIFHLLG